MYFDDFEGNVHDLYNGMLQDPTQQEAALLLIAAVLFKAIEGLQAQHLSTKSLSENDTDVDWQAVWTCAVGPGLELASSLR